MLCREFELRSFNSEAVTGADPDLWKGGLKKELRHYIVSGLIR